MAASTSAQSGPAAAKDEAIEKGQSTKVETQKPIQSMEHNTSATLTIQLCNQTTSNTVYAFITGLAYVETNGVSRAVVALIESDGRSVYYPANPPAIGSPLQTNCAIPLGSPGQTKICTIPQLAGGRIWFSINQPLTFLLNPSPTGAALVEPSVSNPSDPNINIQWDFCEFTFNSSQLYANISYVDFVSLPIALQLTNSSGAVQTVTGMPSTGLSSISSALQTQTSSDGVQGWTNCVVQSSGTTLRILSPNQDLVVRPNDFANYFEPYVQSVWNKYSTSPLSINVGGVITSGEVSTSGSTSNHLVLENGSEVFSAPTTADIFSCSTGPFATGSDSTRNAIIPLLASAFNRTTFLATNVIPSPLSTFYTNAVTNHYARIVHSVNADGKGYAFPYDDVNPSDAGDQSGEVNDPNPVTFLVTVGGGQLQ